MHFPGAAADFQEVMDNAVERASVLAKDVKYYCGALPHSPSTDASFHTATRIVDRISLLHEQAAPLTFSALFQVAALDKKLCLLTLELASKFRELKCQKRSLFVVHEEEDETASVRQTCCKDTPLSIQCWINKPDPRYLCKQAVCICSRGWNPHVSQAIGGGFSVVMKTVTSTQHQSVTHLGIAKRATRRGRRLLKTLSKCAVSTLKTIARLVTFLFRHSNVYTKLACILSLIIYSLCSPHIAMSPPQVLKKLLPISSAPMSLVTTSKKRKREEEEDDDSSSNLFGSFQLLAQQAIGSLVSIFSTVTLMQSVRSTGRSSSSFYRSLYYSLIHSS